MLIEIIRLSVYECNISSRNAGDGSPKAVVNSHLESSDVKVVKVAVEGSIAISSLEVSIMLWSEALAKKVPNMAKNNKNEVTDVGRKEVIVRWLVHHRLRKLSSHVFADISMALTN
jgi:hypothetical protein